MWQPSVWEQEVKEVCDFRMKEEGSLESMFTYTLFSLLTLASVASPCLPGHWRPLLKAVAGDIMAHSPLASEKVWQYCLSSQCLLAEILQLLPTCVSYTWLQGHIVPTAAAPQQVPSASFCKRCQDIRHLPCPMRHWDARKQNSVSPSLSTMLWRFTVHMGRSQKYVLWGGLLCFWLRTMPPICPFRNFSQKRKGGHASDWFFCLLPITYHGQKGMDSPLSMGTILYPSQSRVHSSLFSRAINVRGYGRTWFMGEKDERHIHLRVLKYSLIVVIPEPQNRSATYSNASLKDQSSDSGPYTE